MPTYNFGNIVVVDNNLIGVVVKSWGPIMKAGVIGGYEHEVYVRSLNAINTYPEDLIRHYVYDKELSEESMEYQY